MKLVYFVVLSFVQLNFHEGMDNEIITQYVARLFDEKPITIAQTDLWSQVLVGKRVPCWQGDLANYHHIKAFRSASQIVLFCRLM